MTMGRGNTALILSGFSLMAVLQLGCAEALSYEYACSCDAVEYDSNVCTPLEDTSSWDGTSSEARSIEEDQTALCLGAGFEDCHCTCDLLGPC